MKSNTQYPGDAFIDPDDAPYRNLIDDLQRLERVSAPDDFLYQLRLRIANDALHAKSWWQRLFSFEQGSIFGVPTYAYGSLAAVGILLFSIYVYKTMNVGQQLLQQESQEEMQVTPLTPKASAPVVPRERALITEETPTTIGNGSDADDGVRDAAPAVRDEPNEPELERIEIRQHQKSEQAVPALPPMPATRKIVDPVETDAAAAKANLPGTGLISPKDAEELFNLAAKKDSAARLDSISRVKKSSAPLKKHHEE